MTIERTDDELGCSIRDVRQTALQSAADGVKTTAGVIRSEFPTSPIRQRGRLDVSVLRPQEPLAVSQLLTPAALGVLNTLPIGTGLARWRPVHLIHRRESNATADRESAPSPTSDRTPAPVAGRLASEVTVSRPPTVTATRRIGETVADADFSPETTQRTAHTHATVAGSTTDLNQTDAVGHSAHPAVSSATMRSERSTDDRSDRQTLASRVTTSDNNDPAAPATLGTTELSETADMSPTLGATRAESGHNDVDSSVTHVLRAGRGESTQSAETTNTATLAGTVTETDGVSRHQATTSSRPSYDNPATVRAGGRPNRLPESAKSSTRGTPNRQSRPRPTDRRPEPAQQPPASTEVGTETDAIRRGSERTLARQPRVDTATTGRTDGLSGSALGTTPRDVRVYPTETSKSPDPPRVDRTSHQPPAAGLAETGSERPHTESPEATRTDQKRSTDRATAPNASESALGTTPRDVRVYPTETSESPDPPRVDRTSHQPPAAGLAGTGSERPHTESPEATRTTRKLSTDRATALNASSTPEPVTEHRSRSAATGPRQRQTEADASKPASTGESTAHAVRREAASTRPRKTARFEPTVGVLGRPEQSKATDRRSGSGQSGRQLSPSIAVGAVAWDASRLASEVLVSRRPESAQTGSVWADRTVAAEPLSGVVERDGSSHPTGPIDPLERDRATDSSGSQRQLTAGVTGQQAGSQAAAVSRQRDRISRSLRPIRVPTPNRDRRHEPSTADRSRQGLPVAAETALPMGSNRDQRHSTSDESPHDKTASSTVYHGSADRNDLQWGGTVTHPVSSDSPSTRREIPVDDSGFRSVTTSSSHWSPRLTTEAPRTGTARRPATTNSTRARPGDRKQLSIAQLSDTQRQRQSDTGIGVAATSRSGVSGRVQATHSSVTTPAHTVENRPAVGEDQLNQAADTTPAPTVSEEGRAASFQTVEERYASGTAAVWIETPATVSRTQRYRPVTSKLFARSNITGPLARQSKSVTGQSAAGSLEWRQSSNSEAAASKAQASDTAPTQPVSATVSRAWLPALQPHSAPATGTGHTTALTPPTQLPASSAASHSPDTARPERVHGTSTHRRPTQAQGSSGTDSRGHHHAADSSNPTEGVAITHQSPIQPVAAGPSRHDPAHASRSATAVDSEASDRQPVSSRGEASIGSATNEYTSWPVSATGRKRSFHGERVWDPFEPARSSVDSKRLGYVRDLAAVSSVATHPFIESDRSNTLSRSLPRPTGPDRRDPTRASAVGEVTQGDTQRGFRSTRSQFGTKAAGAIQHTTRTTDTHDGDGLARAVASDEQTRQSMATRTTPFRSRPRPNRQAPGVAGSGNERTAPAKPNSPAVLTQLRDSSAHTATRARLAEENHETGTVVRAPTRVGIAHAEPHTGDRPTTTRSSDDRAEETRSTVSIDRQRSVHARENSSVARPPTMAVTTGPVTEKNVSSSKRKVAPGTSDAEASSWGRPVLARQWHWQPSTFSSLAATQTRAPVTANTTARVVDSQSHVPADDSSSETNAVPSENGHSMTVESKQHPGHTDRQTVTGRRTQEQTPTVEATSALDQIDSRSTRQRSSPAILDGESTALTGRKTQKQTPATEATSAPDQTDASPARQRSSPAILDGESTALTGRKLQKQTPATEATSAPDQTDASPARQRSSLADLGGNSTAFTGRETQEQTSGIGVTSTPSQTDSGSTRRRSSPAVPSGDVTADTGRETQEQTPETEAMSAPDRTDSRPTLQHSSPTVPSGDMTADTGRASTDSATREDDVRSHISNALPESLGKNDVSSRRATDQARSKARDKPGPFVKPGTTTPTVDSQQSGENDPLTHPRERTELKEHDPFSHPRADRAPEGVTNGQLVEEPPEPSAPSFWSADASADDSVVDHPQPSKSIEDPFEGSDERSQPADPKRNDGRIIETQRLAQERTKRIERKRRGL